MLSLICILHTPSSISSLIPLLICLSPLFSPLRSDRKWVCQPTVDPQCGPMCALQCPALETKRVGEYPCVCVCVSVCFSTVGGLGAGTSIFPRYAVSVGVALAGLTATKSRSFPPDMQMGLGGRGQEPPVLQRLTLSAPGWRSQTFYVCQFLIFKGRTTTS